MIKRERYFEKIKPFINKPVIKVITGIRRCGKSTFLKWLVNYLKAAGILSSNILFINKDSLEFDFIDDYKKLNQYVLKKFKGIKGKKYLFIDEVQEITGWEKALAGFLADHIADLYISGSNSRMLSSELATLITGRYIEIPMLTLTFSEFLKFRKTAIRTDTEKEFGLFLKYGGFPGIHQMQPDNEVIAQYVNSIFYTILLKDVVSRNLIRDVAMLELIARFVAGNCGNITSPKKIADFMKSQKMKGSADTVQNYLYWLSAAFLFYKVGRYDICGKRLMEIHEKYYAGDIGLKHGMLGYRMQDISGHLENIVFLELMSRGYQVNIGKTRNREIDFVAVKKNKRMYIQVSYLLADSKTISREFGAMERIKDNYPKIVLSLDKYFDEERNGIKWFNLIDFLLGKTNVTE